jgi:hypothetical protein
MEQAQETLLFMDRGKSDYLTVRPNGILVRFATRLCASSLDRKLARGDSPEATRLLAARAQFLVSPERLRDLAGCWRNVLTQARRPPAMRDPRIRLNQICILACETEVQRLVEALSTPRPVAARTAAHARMLLTDGAGPLYNRNRSGELEDALLRVIAQLDSIQLSHS